MSNINVSFETISRTLGMFCNPCFVKRNKVVFAVGSYLTKD